MMRRATTHGHHTEYDHVYGEGKRGTFQPLLEPRRRTSTQPLTKRVGISSKFCMLGPGGPRETNIGLS